MVGSVVGRSFVSGRPQRLLGNWRPRGGFHACGSAKKWFFLFSEGGFVARVGVSGGLMRIKASETDNGSMELQRRFSWVFRKSSGGSARKISAQ